MEELKDIIWQQAEDAIQRLGVQDLIKTGRVAENVLRQVVYWEQPLQNGEKLLFLRFFSPVVRREEVFLGNILFNDFLSKAFARAITNEGLGRAEVVANDLENYYFLIRSASDVEQMIAAFRNEVERSLPELFFGNQERSRGIYGNLDTMLAFEKANVEPFPVFIMPKSFEERLEKSVRKSLLQKIRNNSMDRNPTSVLANLAFFYSHEGSEMQSPYLFLARLGLRYGVLDPDDLREALNIDKEEVLSDEAAVKGMIEDSLKQKGGRNFSSSHLRLLLEKVVIKLSEKVDLDPEHWRMPYIRSKFLAHDVSKLTDAMISALTIGYKMFVAARQNKDYISCRVCGNSEPEAEDKSILMGQNTHRFHNQSGKQKDREEPKACLRCATCSYLMVKLLGSEAVGQPQVPKTYNLVFHYGKHSDSEVEQLIYGIDLIWSLVRSHSHAEIIRRKVAKQIRELQAKYEREKNTKNKGSLSEEILHKKEELKGIQDNIAEVEENIFEVCPWLRDMGASPVPAENFFLDVLSNLQLSESKVERHILGLGMGGYRMILFILPQIRRDTKGQDFAQRRFSNSRLTLTPFLAFLRELCGCDGPFYYQSLPRLTPDAFQRNMFYIHNEQISVEKAQKEYEIVTQLAWKLVKGYGSDALEDKVVLAEMLIKDPLGKFAAVMRDSPILGHKEGRYRGLTRGYREGWKAEDLNEYARFINQLLKITEVK